MGGRPAVMGTGLDVWETIAVARDHQGSVEGTASYLQIDPRLVEMRLLLDEHLSPEIGRQLRALGHDVIAVGERADLRGRPDRVHFASLPEQQRAILTRDLGDVRPLPVDTVRRGTPTYGIVCVPDRFPLRDLARRCPARLNPQLGRCVSSSYSQLATPPCAEHVPLRCWEKL